MGRVQTLGGIFGGVKRTLKGEEAMARAKRHFLPDHGLLSGAYARDSSCENSGTIEYRFLLRRKLLRVQTHSVVRPVRGYAIQCRPSNP